MIESNIPIVKHAYRKFLEEMEASADKLAIEALDEAKKYYENNR